MAGVFFAMAAMMGPALACKGVETVLRDDFTDQDPAWDVSNVDVQIGGGVLKQTAQAGRIANVRYAGMSFPGGDACVDITMPDSPGENVRAGLGLWTGKGWDFVIISPDGTAGVDRLVGDDWLSPVPNRKFDGVKTGPGAVNRLRITWKAPPGDAAKTAPDPTVTVYINDKQFIRYKVAPNANRLISTYVDGAGSGATFLFKNLVVTNF